MITVQCHAVASATLTCGRVRRAHDVHDHDRWRIRIVDTDGNETSVYIYAVPGALDGVLTVTGADDE